MFGKVSGKGYKDCYQFLSCYKLPLHSGVDLRPYPHPDKKKREENEDKEREKQNRDKDKQNIRRRKRKKKERNLQKTFQLEIQFSYN